MITKPLVALLAAALALTAAGCGEKKETIPKEIEKQNMTVLLDWYANADHAAIYGARAGGNFDEQGLVVKLQVPSDPSAIIKQVAAERADVGISYPSEVLKAREEGAKVRVVAALVPTPLNSIMALKKSKINSIKDLKGKTVGTSGAYTQAYLQTILRKNEVDPGSVKQIDVGFNLQPSLLSRKVDATIGAYWNIEAVELREKNRPVNFFPVNEVGTPDFDELVIIAPEVAFKDRKKTEKIRRFLAALEEGEALAKSDSERVLAELLAANKDLDREIAGEQLKATLPALKRDNDKPWGFLEPQRWTDYANWLRDNELLERRPQTELAYTNELLPGTGPR